MADYALSLVARTPASSGAPSLVEVDRLVAESVSYTDELNRPGSATLRCPVGSMSEAVKERLADLAGFPSEVWIYRDSTLEWAGEVRTLAVDGQAVALNCVGLLGYTDRMGVTADLTYSGVDQFTIAKGLVNHWQGLSYGHYGIDTSGIGTSGVVRDRTYLAAELHNVGRRLQELAAVLDGFDVHVDPATRDLVLSYPTRGTDLTASVFLDARNIDSAAVAMSVAPEDLVSDVDAIGTSYGSGASLTITSARSTPAVRAAYGRSWGSRTFDGVSVQGTLDDYADAFLEVRTGQLFQPGVTLVPRVGLDVGDIAPGDTVSYAYDAGLGLQTGTFRLAKITVTVESAGRQKIGVEFT